MSAKMTGTLLFVLAMACAGAKTKAPANRLVRSELQPSSTSPGLFVGHSESGHLVMAASHYNAMNGMAIEDVDLGLPKRKNGSGKMLCDREVLTGTHLPKWVCRYRDEIDQERQMTQQELMVPRLSFSRGSGSPAITAGRGGGARQN